MAKIVSIFNHKGGGGKTTFLYNLAWSLTGQRQKVRLLDFDPKKNVLH
ncbi:MAG: AAA family ATPase [Spirochaetota bacterium]